MQSASDSSGGATGFLPDRVCEAGERRLLLAGEGAQAGGGDLGGSLLSGALRQRDVVDPLHGLIAGEAGGDEAQRPAMLGRERLAIEFVSQQRAIGTLYLFARDGSAEAPATDQDVPCSGEWPRQRDRIGQARALPAQAGNAPPFFAGEVGRKCLGG